MQHSYVKANKIANPNHTKMGLNNQIRSMIRAELENENIQSQTNYLCLSQGMFTKSDFIGKLKMEVGNQVWKVSILEQLLNSI